uniref:Uncharacterized protein n=1 Tax=Arion vulgaris TaxID=1028688 RepID=A0A0B7AJY3_9EUPU
MAVVDQNSELAIVIFLLPVDLGAILRRKVRPFIAYFFIGSYISPIVRPSLREGAMA